NSQSDPEKNHIVDALSFELGKVKTVTVRERMLFLLANIDKGLASAVAYALGVHIPAQLDNELNQNIPADANSSDYESVQVESSLLRSEALSMANTVKDSIQTRKIAILAADGVNEQSLTAVKAAIEEAGGVIEVIAPRLGFITSAGNEQIQVDESLLGAASVLFDAVYIPGGINSVAALEADADAVHFLNEAFKHCKPIAADEQALQVIEATYFSKKIEGDEGVVIGKNEKQLAKLFVAAIKKHRFWEREKARKIPA
ncbi:MAG TPA: catalase HPII, partial [Bacteroidetes bacterium]|nr:catalase HPII [Bacteroidota bacterium]